MAGGQVVFGGTSNAGGGGGGGTTTNPLTMNNSGAGAASGTNFDGSAAVTLSYNTIGSVPSGSAASLTPPVTIPDTAGNTDLILQNTTVATNATTNASPVEEFAANYWTGAASAQDNWTLGSSLAAGTNGASTFSIAHSGSTGNAILSLPGVLKLASQANSTFANGSLWNFGGILAFTGTGVYLSDTSGNFKLGFELNTAVYYIDLNSGAFLAWTSSAAANGTKDLLLSRQAAGVLAIGTTATVGDATGNLQLNKITKYAAVTTVGAGVPSLVATIDLTAQAAAIAAGTALYAVPAAGAGLYRVTAYAKVTTIGTTSILGGTNGFQLTWTDPTDSTTPTAVTFGDASSQALNGNTTTTIYVTSATVACKASTNLQYGFDYTSTGTAMQFKLSIKVEYIG